MGSYAQTNLQLYNQLLRSGYSAADVLGVRRAYELAMRLFTGCFRGSGKPFLAHAVGTAGILASTHARPTVLSAGLLHATYTRGEFGNGWRGMSAERREQVRAAVGGEVEDLVAGYTRLRWDADSIPAIRENLAEMAAFDRDVLLIRLANELEDHLDLGVLYCGDAARRRRHITSSLHPCIDMARQLGAPALAADLASAFDEALSVELPMALLGEHGASFRLAPASHRPRLRIALRHLFGRRLV